MTEAVTQDQSRIASWLGAVPRWPAFSAAVIASLLAAVYWGLIASDRYVSEARIVIQRTDFSNGQSFTLGSLLGAGGASNKEDQLLLRDYLLSVDMLNKLDARLDLRGHYSDGSRDPISRMWPADASLERFHRHYLSRVSVEFDDYLGVLAIKAQAYDPGTARAIAALLVEEGERFMNAMAHALAREQVAFLEKQVTELHDRLMRERKVVLDFQNRNGLASPEATAENVAAIINRLDGQLAELRARRTAMLGYLMPDSPNMVEVDLQISAIEKQARIEKARLTSPKGRTLNRAVEEFQRLQMNAGFAQDVYKTALVALESGRVEATRTLKKVSVLQQPFEPQYSAEPRRLYNSIVFMLMAFVLAGTAQLMGAVIRDHKD